VASTSFTSSKADLPAVLNNVARRYSQIATSIDISLGGSNVTVDVVWPDDATDPGDPGPDPTIVTLGNSLSAVTDNLVNEQARVSNLFAERIDLQKQRSDLTAQKAALETDKALVESLLSTARSEKTTLEAQLVAKQKEIDDLKAARP